MDWAPPAPKSVLRDGRGQEAPCSEQEWEEISVYCQCLDFIARWTEGCWHLTSCRNFMGKQFMELGWDVPPAVWELPSHACVAAPFPLLGDKAGPSHSHKENQFHAELFSPSCTGLVRNNPARHTQAKLAGGGDAQGLHPLQALQTKLGWSSEGKSAFLKQSRGCSWSPKQEEGRDWVLPSWSIHPEK